MRRVAIIGSGISGLGAAHGLKGCAQVTLFEAGSYFGGHTHTVDVTLDGHTHGVDTGFLVLNERTYPRLLTLFAELGVEIAPSDMSFSVQVPDIGLEWSGSDLSTVFAQRSNLFKPRFWRMLRDILRFNRAATLLARTGGEDGLALGEYLDRHGYSREFRDWYLLPMAAAIWSCPTRTMMAYPLSTFVRFCDNHGLLRVSGRPQWLTVRGGGREYVRRMCRQLDDVRVNSPVRRIVRDDDGAWLTTPHGVERFDQVVLACHSDQALAILGEEATPAATQSQKLGVTWSVSRAAT